MLDSVVVWCSALIFVLGLIKVMEIGSKVVQRLIRESVLETKSVEFLLKIRNASRKLKEEGSIGETGQFYLAGGKWSVALQVEGGNVILNLKKKSLSSSIPKMFWSVGIEHCDRHVVYIWYDMPVEVQVSGWNFPGISYLHANRKTLLPDDTLALFVRLSSYPSVEKIQKVLHTLSENLKDLYLEDKDHDVKITVGNETFGAHRAILKARSHVLSAMSTYKMLEAGSGDVRLEDCDPKDFAVLLRFLYSGTVDGLTGDNVASVYEMADKYDVPELAETCARYMVSTLTPRSVSDVVDLALKHGNRQLLAVATDFFLKHAEEIFPTVEWKRFLRDRPTRANELVIQSYSFKKS